MLLIRPVEFFLRLFCGFYTCVKCSLESKQTFGTFYNITRHVEMILRQEKAIFVGFKESIVSHGQEPISSVKKGFFQTLARLSFWLVDFFLHIFHACYKFLKCLLEVNNIPLSDELKNVHSKTLETQLLDNFYTKDGYNMGSKKMFINKVTKEVSELEFSGLKIDGSKVWDCIIEHKVPTLTSEAFLKILKKDISKLFPTDENEIDALMSCVGDGFSIGESYVELCKKRYLNAGFSTFESTSYCDCEYEKLKEKVVDYQAFKKYYSEIGDEHKDSYNEVILPCRNLVEKKRMSNNYNPEDIEGFSDESFIKLTASGSTFKIKLVIEGVSRYFTFDSGASELIINADLEKELLDKKLITASNYVKSKSFSTADGSIVNAKGLILNNIVIGGFKVHNVTAYITDKGGMLCGMGLLNKFKNWEFDKDQSMLVIYK